MTPEKTPVEAMAEAHWNCGATIPWAEYFATQPEKKQAYLDRMEAAALVLYERLQAERRDTEKSP